MELTLRTPVALDALKAVRAEVPEMIAGVGTILTPIKSSRPWNQERNSASLPG